MERKSQTFNSVSAFEERGFSAKLLCGTLIQPRKFKLYAFSHNASGTLAGFLDVTQTASQEVHDGACRKFTSSGGLQFAAHCYNYDASDCDSFQDR
jgi:hypothetical protein